MAKGTKNSGFYKQDAVMAKMSADARKPQEVNAVVKAAMAQAERTFQGFYPRRTGCSHR